MVLYLREFGRGVKAIHVASTILHGRTRGNLMRVLAYIIFIWKGNVPPSFL